MRSSSPAGAPALRTFSVCASLALAGSAAGQDMERDLRPLPDDRNPVAMAASPFHVWVATPKSLSRWSRIGGDAPVWYGPGHDLPLRGIASACWDDRTGRLRLLGGDNASYEWNESTRRATPSNAEFRCESSISRIVASGDLPSLIPEEAGWMYQAGALKEPGGREAKIRLAMVVEDRELWLATNTAGIWKGRWPSGRVTPLSTGLGETCIERAAAERDGSIWILGCGGSLARLSPSGEMQSIDPRSPRWRDLHHAIDLTPAPEGGVWIAVPSGLVRATASGIAERLVGRKAPFGGLPVALATLGDTVWSLAEHGLSANADGEGFEAIPIEDSGATFRILCIAPSRMGLLAGTPNGFRLWDGTRWIRPASLFHAGSRPVLKAAVEPGKDRIAWFDGSVVRVDTLRYGGAIGAWIPPKQTLSDFAWGREGRLHFAHQAWTIWNPDDGQTRTWTLPVRSEIVVPGAEWTFVGGTTGGIQARTTAWSP